MSTALTTTEQKPLSLSAEQVKLLKATICKGASDLELALFMEVCKSKRLDPFSGQIHAVKRSEYDKSAGGYVDRMTYQTGIDGFRLIADRTGERNGEDDPEWCGEDGIWLPIWLHKAPPSAARVRVYRKGHDKPYTGIAQWSFYAQTKKDGSPNRMWERGGPHMLAKCAEALALRKAFPSELAGLYTSDEMGQVERSRKTEAIDAEVVEELPPAPTRDLDEWNSIALLAASISPAAVRKLRPEFNAMPEGTLKESVRLILNEARQAAARREAERIASGRPPDSTPANGSAGSSAEPPTVDAGATP